MSTSDSGRVCTSGLGKWGAGGERGKRKRKREIGRNRIRRSAVDLGSCGATKSAISRNSRILLRLRRYMPPGEEKRSMNPENREIMKSSRRKEACNPPYRERGSRRSASRALRTEAASRFCEIYAVRRWFGTGEKQLRMQRAHFREVAL